MAAAHLLQQYVGQVVSTLGACLLGWLGDGQPQLPFGHRRHQIAVLDRASQLRIVGAAGLEVGAHPEHDQRRRFMVRPVPDRGRRVQRDDERAPLLLIGALGEQLLELVNDQQQAPQDCPPGPCEAAASPPGCASAAWRAVSANPAGSASSPRRTAAASAPASRATRTASSSSGARAGVNSRHGQDAAPGADTSPVPRIRGSTPARSSDDLPAPDTPDTTSRPAPSSCRDIRASTWVAAASRPKKNAASRSSNALSPRYGESITPETVTSGGGTTPSAQVCLL